MTREEAIKIVKDLYDKSLFLKKDKEAVRTLIPEVEESEDEKIRQWLIGYFNQYIIDGMPQVFGNGLNVKDVIAWLEKQGKDTLEDTIFDSNEDGLIAETIRYKNEKQDEQKHAWSEEDYNEIETIACHLDNIGNEAMAKSLLNIMDKYKSCRPQNTWKPSDEQISVLSRSLKYINTISQNYCHVLGELLAQLKKLKEE